PSQRQKSSRAQGARASAKPRRPVRGGIFHLTGGAPAPPQRSGGSRLPIVSAFSLFQLGQRFLKTSERNRNSDTRLLGLEDDEDGSLAVLQLLDQRILDHHLRVAGERVAAQKGRMPHILVVDLQSKSRR